jgi:hypothetical protein
MASRALPAIEPEELLGDLLGLDPGLRREAYDGERLAFCLTPDRFAERFGQRPRRLPKGGFVDLTGYDLTRLGELLPHPVAAWMRWAQILSPSRPPYESLKPLLAESLEVVKAKWTQRKVNRCSR